MLWSLWWKSTNQYNFSIIIPIYVDTKLLLKYFKFVLLFSLSLFPKCARAQRVAISGIQRQIFYKSSHMIYKIIIL